MMSLLPIAMAQTVSPPAQLQQVLNGLVAPTSSQQYFEQGQQQLEQEIQHLRKQEEYPSESILHISEELLRQKPILQLEHPQNVPNGGELY
jgi:hypothetical protein